MTASLSDDFVRSAQDEMRRAGVEAWLLYDFHGRNAVAGGLLGMPEGQKRRFFVLLKPDALPHAIVHRIEESGWQGWSHELETYVGWEELRSRLGAVLDGLSTVAMEVYPMNGVPYVDNVPAGVVELIESLGPRVTSSVELISRTAAQWGEVGRALHLEAAETLAAIARGAYERAVASLDGASPVTEYQLAEWVRATAADRGLTGVDTIVAVGPNAARPHYEPPAEGSASVAPEQVFLVDLWGKVGSDPRAVYADQTWMGFTGRRPPDEVEHAWRAIADGRDAAVELVAAAGTGGVSGADVDQRVRAILIERGYEDALFHRTGHGIDREIHGVGPSIDSIESNDERRLVPGIGFSIEPGVYLQGRFGLRTEINVFIGEHGPEVSPERIQRDLWVTA